MRDECVSSGMEALDMSPVLRDEEEGFSPERSRFSAFLCSLLPSSSMINCDS